MSSTVATEPGQADRRCERCRNRRPVESIQDQDAPGGARVICFRCFQASRDDRDAEPPADTPRPQPSPAFPGGRALGAVDIAHRRRMLAHLRATPGRG